MEEQLQLNSGHGSIIIFVLLCTNSHFACIVISGMQIELIIVCRDILILEEYGRL